MRIFVIIAMLMASMFTGQAIAENVWKAPALDDCSAVSGAKRKKDCNHINYCISSSNISCLAHVGDTREDQGRSGLLNGCFDKTMHQCVAAADHSSTLSTNLANNPDAWDCITNPGTATQGKASPDRCRMVNFCLGSAGTTCSDKIGPAKYTDKGQYDMAVCVQETEIACMRALD